MTLYIEDGNDSDLEVSFSLFGIQNVRSMKPSSAFNITTLVPEDFVVDSGGQDIIVQVT